MHKKARARMHHLMMMILMIASTTFVTVTPTYASTIPTTSNPTGSINQNKRCYHQHGRLEQVFADADLSNIVATFVMDINEPSW